MSGSIAGATVQDMKNQSFLRLKRLLAPSIPLLLSGCNLTVLDPKGMIGAEEKTLIIVVTALMLLVVIPVIVLTLVFAWKYRATNTKARYEPDWAHSNAIEVVVWLIPCLIIIALGVITYRSTHALDPYKPIESDVKPITVEAISLDWKWLFIYPELKIATVNQIAFPANTPINFKITSDSVMNAFFIPQLGSQVYAMAGMQTKLHLIANETGQFDGISSNYSGAGFTGMKFVATSMTNEEFDAWVKQVRASSQSLTKEGYAELAKPSEKVPPAMYASVDPTLYHSILHKYMGDSDKVLTLDEALEGANCTTATAEAATRPLPVQSALPAPKAANAARTNS
ncbi:Cytochrome bo(3) ubiquinol oxidase subunit 2 [Ralstonia syzygii subsp. syzygii]|nr:Cytochrome bo(3) ubiquinol oxidase subunit 2 [Ralstonia syzygii subsp. syzygii]